MLAGPGDGGQLLKFTHEKKVGGWSEAGAQERPGVCSVQALVKQRPSTLPV